jgi:glycerol-3-phosphate dehydrogenase (NAD(P)+)
MHRATFSTAKLIMTTLSNTKNSVAIIGAGAWGCSLSIQFCKALNVTLYIRNKETYLEIKNYRTNNEFLPGIHFPEEINITSDIKQIQSDKIDYILIAVPSYAIESIAQTIKQLNISCQIPIILATKGINAEGILLSEVINQYLANPLAILSGPNLAIEVASNKPTIATIACQDIKLASQIASIFSTDTFLLIPNNLSTHAQIAGCIKNIAAIICGISKAYYFSDNTQAYIVMLALNEIITISSAIEKKAPNSQAAECINHYLNAAVVGDLVACCYSLKSRNFSFGNAIAKVDKLKRKDFIKNYPILVEGKNNAANLIKLCNKFNTYSAFASLLNKIITDPENMETYMQTLLTKK